MTTAKTSLLAIAASALLLSGSVWAQPTTEEEDNETAGALPGDATTEEYETPYEPAPPPPEETAPVADESAAPAPVAPALDSGAEHHPTVFTIGIGFGYTLPADIDQPNTTSVRFRLASGLTFEPTLILSTSQSTDDNGTDETKDALNTVGLMSTVRYPLISRGPFDFIIGGGAGLQFTTQDPDGSDNNSSFSTIFLTWGIAIDYWLSHNWSFSMSAFNPLISYSSSEQEFGTNTATQSETSIGAVFDPTIFAMLHMFY